MSGQQFFPPHLDQYSYFHSSQKPPNGLNSGFYRNAAVDRALESAQREMDEQRRLELYRQIHRLLAADPPADFLWSVDQYWAVSNRLTGVEVSPLGLFHFLPGPLAWRRPAARPPGERPPVPAPLDGVLVVDLSRVLAGPFCTMLLADLGARVIKVEAPEGGDVTRGWGPPYDPASGLSAYYLAVNRNKESIALDLATEKGRPSIRILARRADVVVENFPPGGLEKFGLSLAAMREENPRLVTASITGFGRTGPDAAAPGFDLLAQAGSGLMAITGEAGRPADEGRRGGLRPLRGLLRRAVGIAAALRGREVTGVGAHVETDLMRASAAALINVGEACLVTGREAERHGNAHPQIVPYRTFAASDGDFVIAAGTDPQFARLCADRRAAGVGA